MVWIKRQRTVAVLLAILVAGGSPFGANACESALKRLGADALPDKSGRRFPAVETRSGLTSLTREEAIALFSQGYTPRKALFSPEFAARFVEEMKRLREEGVLKGSVERTIDGVATELGLSVGAWEGGRPPAGFMTDLYAELKEFALAFNESFPEYRVNPDTAELNISIAFPGWTGLHLHVDHHRFTEALRKLPEEKHHFIKERTLTITFYARENAGVGGGLRVVPPKGKEREALHLPSSHNTGVVFFARTPHGVDPIPKEGNENGLRYSFQIFFHAVPTTEPPPSAWNKKSAEIIRELQDRGSQ